MRTHVHEEFFPAPPHQLFALLHTPSAIRQWWGAACALVLAEPGGIWAATWGDSEDDPDYLTAATIRDFAPPHRMVLTDYRYRDRSGPLPFKADFEIEFVVQPGEGGSMLRVSQAGFPTGAEADAFFAACESGWAFTFAGIRRYLTPTSGADEVPR